MFLSVLPAPVIEDKPSWDDNTSLGQPQAATLGFPSCHRDSLKRWATSFSRAPTAAHTTPHTSQALGWQRLVIISSAGQYMGEKITHTITQ